MQDLFEEIESLYRQQSGSRVAVDPFLQAKRREQARSDITGKCCHRRILERTVSNQ